MAKNVGKILGEELPGLKENLLLKDFTTYKIGGPAKFFFIAKTAEDLIKALKTAKDLKLPVFVLGGGSNLLVSEKGFKGLVVKMDIDEVVFKKNKIFAGAGAKLTKLADLTASAGYSGLEWSAGIPGTLGGAIYGHAQAFGEKISDSMESVEALDLKTLKIKTFSKEQCKFTVKNSVFKKSANGQGKLIIISAVLSLRKKEPGKAKEKIKEFLAYRREHHPVDYPSAGSTFVNPKVKIKNKKLLAKFPELNFYNEKGFAPSGYLISKVGLMGKKRGNAQISEKHANFIVNLGGAKSKDVLFLIKLAQKEVKKVFGINLEPEVQTIGF